MESADWIFLGCDNAYLASQMDGGSAWVTEALTFLSIIVSLGIAVAAFTIEKRRQAKREHENKKNTTIKLVQFMVLGKAATEAFVRDVQTNKEIGIYRIRSTLAQIERVIDAIDHLIAGPVKEHMVITLCFGYHQTIEQIKAALIDIEDQLKSVLDQGQSQKADSESIVNCLATLAADLEISTIPLRAFAAKLQSDKDAIFPTSGEVTRFWREQEDPQ